MLHSTIVANKHRDASRADAATQSRPLTPRSIVLSLLLGSHPPKMPVGRILEFTSLFGLSDGAVRTALSRLVATGDVDNDEGAYQLTGRLLIRQAEQDSGRDDPPARWDRTWWSVTVLPERRPVAERRAFRTRAAGARLGELRPDVWFRPANIELPPDTFEQDDVVVTRSTLLAGDDHVLARRLWHFDALGHTADKHLAQLERSAVELEGGGDNTLAEVFAALAAAQRFLRVEPQLPAEVDPPPAGAAVRAAYGEVVERFQGRLATFFAGNNSPDAVSTAGR